MDAFLSVSAGSQHQRRLREYAQSLLRQGCTKPAWCVLGLEAGKPVVRAALWALPGQAVPTDIVLVDAPWDEEDLVAGHALLARVHELARALGADSLSHHVDSPPRAPQYQENDDQRIHLLVGSGYQLLRDGVRWRYSHSGLQAESQEPALAFRPLPEVGEGAFVEAIASTYEGTRDTWITRDIEERGTQGAAQADFLAYQGLDYEPEWWELAFTQDGALAGVIMAARNPSSAVIGYVGVVPEQRGRGLARQLVRRGTDSLLAAGATEIGGDCDRDNVPMVKAFERAGYERVARRRSYHHAMTLDL